MTVSIDLKGIPDEALRVLETGSPVVVEQDGTPVALLVSPRYMKVFQELVDELEERLDVEAYLEARREIDEQGSDPVTLEEFSDVYR